MFNNLFSFTSIGLTFDGVGVAILGFAFFAAKTSSFFLNAATFVGANPMAMEDGITARTDGIAGTILLFVGFILQVLGANGVACEIAAKILYSFLAVIVICYFLIIRKKLISHQMKKAKEFGDNYQNRPKPS